MRSLAWFWDVVTLGGCAPCFGCRLVPEQRSRCERVSGGVMDAHHVVAQQVLKREFPLGARRQVGAPADGQAAAWGPIPRGWESEPGWDVWTLDEILSDPRNGVTLRRFHHDAIEWHRLVVPRASLPAAVEAFAGELGLGWLLDRNFGPREAAALVNQQIGGL